MGFLSTKRSVLITGASRGIGRELALQLAARGHHVIAAARDTEALAALADEIRAALGHATALPLDVTDPLGVQQRIGRLLEQQPLDALVNNAGILDQAPFVSQSSDTRAQEMSINYFGALRMSEAVLPAMMAARDGAIVNVSSILASVGTPTTANYGATKAALEVFSYGLRHEMEPYGVKVTVFVAPHTQTAMGSAAEFKGVRSFPPSWVARELVQALDARPRRYVARGVLRMGLRLAAWFPAYMESQLSAMVRHRLPEAAPTSALATATEEQVDGH